MMKTAGILTTVLVLGGMTAAIAGESSPPGGPVFVELKDGTRLVGRVISDEDGLLRVRTEGGLAVEVRRDTVVAIRRRDEGGFERGVDPNYSRLMFAPTGRPLRKGDGYFSDYELFFPGVAVGLTDNLSLAGGVSVIPTLGLTEQVFYVSPKLGHQFSERAAVSVGALYATVGGDFDRESAGVAFGMGTFGGRNRSLTVGLGLADADLEDGFEPTPIVVLGGTATVSRHVALVTEAWIALEEGLDLSTQPVGAGVRFFGDRLSADVGLVVLPGHLDEGGFFPWLSMTYHFGPTQVEARRQASRSR